MSGWIQAAVQQNTMATVPIFILTITENGLATSNHSQMPYQTYMEIWLDKKCQQSEREPQNQVWDHSILIMQGGQTIMSIHAVISEVHSTSKLWFLLYEKI